MVREHFKVRQLVHQAGKDDPRHRRARFVGPTEGPPDLVVRRRLAFVIGDVGAPRGMEEDRPAGLRREFEDGEEARVVERHAGDVRMDLQADRAVRERALGLAHRRGGIVHRQGGEIGVELAGVLDDELGQAVVAEPRQLDRGLRRSEQLERRHAERQHLGVVVRRLKLLDDRQPPVEVEDRRDVAHAFGDVLPGQRGHARPNGRREEMVEAIDVAHGGVLGRPSLAQGARAGTSPIRRSPAERFQALGSGLDGLAPPSSCQALGGASLTARRRPPSPRRPDRPRAPPLPPRERRHPRARGRIAPRGQGQSAADRAGA